MRGLVQFLMLQPPYSPDLAPCDFILFHKVHVKLAVIGHNFVSTEEIQLSVTQVLRGIPQDAFQECRRWQHRWKRCVQAQGMYFERDHIVVDK